MENKLDKLFRSKLEQHSIQPSANAWEKVANGSKKNNGVVWFWRIAAALALAGLIGWYGFDASTRTEQLQAGKETKGKKQVEVKIVQDKGKDKTSSVNKVEITNSDQQSNPNQQSVKTNTTLVTPTPDPDQPEIKKTIVEDEKQLEVTVTFVEEVEESSLVVEAVQPKKVKAMVIVYTLAPVEKRQDVEPVKPTGIKKVIEYAKDVKGGETTTVASMRDWKDNFFGLNDQTRVEKKKIIN